MNCILLLSYSAILQVSKMTIVINETIFEPIDGTKNIDSNEGI